jgi:glutamate 5-kinase
MANPGLTVVLGSSSIVDEKTHEPILSILSLIVETAIRLRRDGHRVVIVSSGAIAVGLQRMSIAKKPKHLAQVQVGRTKMGESFADLFSGSCSNRTVKVDVDMGFSICACQPAGGPDSAYT